MSKDKRSIQSELSTLLGFHILQGRRVRGEESLLLKWRPADGWLSRNLGLKIYVP